MVHAASDPTAKRAVVPMSRFGSTPRVRREDPEFVDPGPRFFASSGPLAGVLRGRLCAVVLRARLRALAGQLDGHPLQQLRDLRLALVSVIGQ
jgi:hypothetical protein